MSADKTLFAQTFELVPETIFVHTAQRYRGNSGVRTLYRAGQVHAVAFAQLTWGKCLRDLEPALAANTSKLYAMGFRASVKH